MLAAMSGLQNCKAPPAMPAQQYCCAARSHPRCPRCCPGGAPSSHVSCCAAGKGKDAQSPPAGWSSASSLQLMCPSAGSHLLCCPCCRQGRSCWCLCCPFLSETNVLDPSRPLCCPLLQAGAVVPGQIPASLPLLEQQMQSISCRHTSMSASVSASCCCTAPLRAGLLSRWQHIDLEGCFSNAPKTHLRRHPVDPQPWQHRSKYCPGQAGHACATWSDPAATFCTSQLTL